MNFLREEGGVGCGVKGLRELGVFFFIVYFVFFFRDFEYVGDRF